MRIFRFALLLGSAACAVIACSSTGVPVSPAPDASASDSSPQSDVAAPDASFEASTDGAPDGEVVAQDAGTDGVTTEAATDALILPDRASLPDGACTPPNYDACDSAVYLSDSGPSSPTWDAATKQLTFRLADTSWIVLAGTAIATLTGADGGTSTMDLAVEVTGADLVVDLTSTLADPGVQMVTVTQLLLTDACGALQAAATGGSGGTFFGISIQRTAPVFTNSGCQTYA
jgi:hypothetical protein